MRSSRFICFVFLLAGVAVVTTSCNLVASSHVGANVPKGNDFDQFLKRDLEAYFTGSMGKHVTVDCEL